LSRVNQFTIKDKRAYIEVKKLPYTEVRDADIVPDGVGRGDQLIAVYEEGTINTVFLRKSWEQSTEYRKIFRKPKKA
jgi:hypothetical protein